MKKIIISALCTGLLFCQSVKAQEKPAMSAEELAKKLGFTNPETVTEAELLLKVQELQDEKNALAKEQAAMQETQAEELVASAEKSGKISAAQKPFLKAQAVKDYTGTKAFLEGMQSMPGGGRRIAGELNTQTQALVPQGDHPKTWAELTAQGGEAVDNYQKKFPAQFDALADAHYGVSKKRTVR